MKCYNVIIASIFCIFCTNSEPKNIAIDYENNKENNYISTIDFPPKDIIKLNKLSVFSAYSEPTHKVILTPQKWFNKGGKINLNKIHKSFEDGEGRLIVWGDDINRNSVIFVFNNDGILKTQLGGQGKGPGEYGTILNLFVRDSKIYISDFTSMRLNEYSTESYSFIRSSNFEIWDVNDNLDFKRHIIPRYDGNYLCAYSEKFLEYGQIEIHYILMDIQGIKKNYDLTFPSGFMIEVNKTAGLIKPTIPLWFMDNTTLYLSNKDVLFTVSNREFLIKKFDRNGRYLSAIYYPLEGPSFDLNEYLESAGSLAPNAKEIRNAFKSMELDMPKSAPFIEDLIIDDENRIWVALKKGQQIEWWILNESGKLIAKLALPKEQRIFDIKKGFLYTPLLDEETGTEYVVKYHIEFSENKSR